MYGYFTSCFTCLVSFHLCDSFLQGGCYCPSFTDGEAETQRDNFFKIAQKGQDLSAVPLIVSKVFFLLLL